jgi:zinc protease
MFYAGVMTQSETTAEAINAILEQIRRLQDEPVSERELRDTVDRFLNSLVFQYDSRASVLNERMSLDYAGLDPETFDRLVEEIQQVTIDDIQRVAQQYLKPDALQILVVGNGAEIGDQLEQFGEVKMIDITIPVPGEAEEETVAGDAAAGAEWLSRMASALLPDGPIEGDLIFEADNTVQGPMGEMVLGVRQTVNFAEEKLIAEVTAPMGQITMQIVDGEGVMMMGGNQMPMPPAQKEEMLSEHKRNPLYIAMNAGTFTSEYHGMTEMEGGNFVHIVLIGDTRINLYLNPETAEPASITFRQFDPEQGQQVTGRRVFTGWTLNDGVMLPYQTDVYQGDDKISSITVKTHSVE